jgi:hypothetical protein
VASKIYGPHFEDLARRWCFEHASEDTLGGSASRVRPTQLGCPEHRRGHELDVVVTEHVSFGTDRIIAIGEAKSTSDPVGLGHLERLEHVRTLLPAALTEQSPRLLLFSRSGFNADLLRVVESRSDVELIDLHRLYRGD